jgi:metalloprotein, YbeY/UPF0054 family
MQCDTYNGHAKYRVDGAEEILNTLEQFAPINYDELSVAFLDEAAICDLHAKFLNNPESTDVITFPADENEDYRVGEICISIDEALKYPQYALKDELTLYLVHGWLHLAGYDDIDPKDRLVMREMEQKALSFLNQQSCSRLAIESLSA